MEAQNLWFNQLTNLLRSASEKRFKVVLFGSLPSLTKGSDVICAIKIGHANNSSKFCEDNVQLRRSSIHGKKVNNQLELNIKKLENSFSNFSYIDISKTFCNDLRKCSIVSNEMMYMSDIVHFSNRASLKIYSKVKEEMHNTNVKINFP